MHKPPDVWAAMLRVNLPRMVSPDGCAGHSPGSVDNAATPACKVNMLFHASNHTREGFSSKVGRLILGDPNVSVTLE